MAIYYIHAAHQEGDVIKTVKTCTSYSSSGPDTETEKTRATLIVDIDTFGKSVYILYKNKSNNWIVGAEVITEIVDRQKYIKTVKNYKKCDNLDYIIQY